MFRSFKTVRTTCVRKFSTNAGQSNYNRKVLAGLLIGAGVGIVGGSWYLQQLFAKSNDTSDDIALDPQEFRKFRLQSISYYNHNSNIFRIAFPSPDQTSGLTAASYLLIKGTNSEGKAVVRPYTPINSLDTTGHIDLLIKEYPEGNVSKYVHNLQVGDSVEIKGPFKSLDYSPNMKKELGMIAGGTGVAPMIQLLRKIFENSSDKTKVSMIFANIAEEDILLREYLDDLAANHPNRFQVFYTLDNPPSNWKGGKGYVTTDMVKQNLPNPSSDHLILFCGPPPMEKAVAGPKAKDWTQGEVGGVLKDLGYSSDMVYKF